MLTGYTPYIVPGFTWVLSLMMVLVILSDVRHYIISNRLNLTLLGLYGLAIFLLPVDPLSALGAAAIVFAVGLGSYALGFMGGGDVKLLFALSLWTGWHMATVEFLFLTAIFGGVIVVLMLMLRAVLPKLFVKLCPTKNLPRILTKGQPVPYGLAIAPAFLFMLWVGDIPVLR